MLGSLRNEEEWQAFTEAVKSYKYSSPTLSLLERLYLDAFWNKIVHIYPMWLAPNVITLGGYVCVWLAYLLTITFSPDLKGELQNWQYIVSGLLYFLYQSLDGSDGKQARRTGAGSALGELMDHGVDAVVTALLCLLTADVFAFGITSPWVWVFIMSAQMNFFLSNMTLVHSGRQMFFDLDVMEVQTLMISVLLVAGIFGPETLNALSFPIPDFARFIYIDFWGTVPASQAIDLSDGRLSLRNLVIMGGLSGCFVNYPQYIFASLRPYLKKFEDRPQHVKNGVAGTGIGALLFHLVLIHVYIALTAASVLKVGQLTDQTRAAAAMRGFGIIVSFGFADLMDRVLLMRVGRRPLPLVPPGFLPVVGFLVGIIYMEPRQLTDAPWWWVLAAISFILHHTYFITSVLNLAKVLGIHPLKIKPKKNE